MKLKGIKLIFFFNVKNKIIHILYIKPNKINISYIYLQNLNIIIIDFFKIKNITMLKK